MADTPANFQAAESYLAASLNLSDVTAATARVNLGVPRTLFSYIADVGNVSTGEDDLFTSTIPAATLDTNGQLLRAYYSGIFVAHATATRQIKAYFGGTNIMTSNAAATTAAQSWRINLDVIRVSNTVVRCSVELSCRLTVAGSGGNVFGVGSIEVTGLNLTTTGYILKLTGEAAAAGAATNDIVAKSGAVIFQPA